MTKLQIGQDSFVVFHVDRVLLSQNQNTIEEDEDSLLHTRKKDMTLFTRSALFVKFSHEAAHDSDDLLVHRHDCRIQKINGRSRWV